MQKMDRRQLPGHGSVCPSSLRCVGAAAVSRVWEHARAAHGFRPVAAVNATCVAHEDRLLLDTVTVLASGTALVDGVFVVEALADRVPFDNLIAHGGGKCGRRVEAKTGQCSSVKRRIA